MSTMYVNNIAPLEGNTINVASGSTLTQPGSVIQVATGESTGSAITSSSDSYIDTGLSISITPKFTSSKIIVTFTFTSTSNQTNAQGGTAYQIYRNDSVELYTGSVSGRGVLSYFSSSGYIHSPNTITVFDTPAATVNTKYSLYMRIIVASQTAAVQRDWGGVQMVAMEIAQ